MRSNAKQKMMSLGEASLAKMTSLGGGLTALVCHPTKRVKKAEELTYKVLDRISLHYYVH